MENLFRESIWNQFGASIDMLENVIQACPESLWSDRSKDKEFWYWAYHPLFWLDCYLSDSEDGFAPPAPFTLSEFDPEGILPERIYSKEEVLIYLNYGREKLMSVINKFNKEYAEREKVFGTLKLTNSEFLLYNMRHVQHHTAQLNMLLRQEINSAPGWVRQSRIVLSN